MDFALNGNFDDIASQRKLFSFVGWCPINRRVVRVDITCGMGSGTVINLCLVNSYGLHCAMKKIREDAVDFQNLTSEETMDKMLSFAYEIYYDWVL